MNLGQLLLIVLALAVLAIVQQTINASISRETLVTLDSEARINSISVAQAMLDEINSKAFDSSTVGKIVYYTSGLTPVSKLGREASNSRGIDERTVPANDRAPYQSQVKFDDIDDYKWYTRIDSSFNLGPFYVRVNVNYVNPNNLDDTTSANPTWYKRIVVVVKQLNLVDSVSLKSIATYRQYF